MPETPGWLLLIHQLPPRPLYLRAQVRRRLVQVGAVPLKNSVYVLPDTPECLEDLQWIGQEAVAGGGEAIVCRAAFLGTPTDTELRAGSLTTPPVASRPSSRRSPTISLLSGGGRAHLRPARTSFACSEWLMPR